MEKDFKFLARFCIYFFPISFIIYILFSLACRNIWIYNWEDGERGGFLILELLLLVITLCASSDIKIEENKNENWPE